MYVLGLILSIGAVIFSSAVPILCRGPCTIHNDKMKQHNIHLKNNRMQHVAHNEVIAFKCVPGYEISDRKNLTTNCNEGAVTYPSCHLKEQKMKKKACLPPPKVLFGESMGQMKEVYYSGSTIQFKCLSYYKLKGKQYIKCKNGVWDRPPTCMEPCTLNYNYIKGNNTIVNARERYLKHNQTVQFKCLPTFRPADPKLLKVKCLNGKLKYPKCVKTGLCTLNENTMLKNNITVKSVNTHCGSQRSPNKCDIKPYKENETIEFSCLSGYEISDHEELKVKCHRGVVEYPACLKKTPDESTIQPSVQTGIY